MERYFSPSMDSSIGPVKSQCNLNNTSGAGSALLLRAKGCLCPLPKAQSSQSYLINLFKSVILISSIPFTDFVLINLAIAWL